MKDLRKVLKLYGQGKSKLFISQYLKLSRNTVYKYIFTFENLNKPINQILELSNEELENLFLAKSEKVPSPKQEALYAFFPYMDKELKKVGATVEMMWQEYIERHPDGYRRTQFHDYYRRWSKTAKPLMHITHKAGDKMYIDYAGKKLQLVDQENGEIKELEFFVAVLGASQYTYAEASLSQNKEEFVKSTERALQYFGGVPKAIVPDNLKSAVIKANRYEPSLNETFQDFADHYNTTVLPARVRKPRDKSLVEGAVKILYTRIYHEINKHVYHELDDLNLAVWELLEKHNKAKLSRRPYSRLDLFKEVEMASLEPLRQEPYEFKQIAWITVMLNGHISLGQDKHYYSVPYQYIKKKVKLIYSASQVEVFHNFTRIAFHRRDKTAYGYTTIKEHMASAHKYTTEWNHGYFLRRGKEIHEDVEKLIQKIMQKKHHPEQAYKSCMGVLSLERKYSRSRLIKACQRALEFGSHNYKTVQRILEKGLDKLDEEQEQEKEQMPDHENIRGRKYYK